MKHRRPTVADLLSIKGKRQLTMLRVVTLEEAEAAEKAGIDLVSVPPALLGHEFREAAPTVFAFPGLNMATLSPPRTTSGAHFRRCGPAVTPSTARRVFRLCADCARRGSRSVAMSG